MDSFQLVEFITNLGSLFICLCVAVLLLKFRSSQELERRALIPIKATANYTTVRHIVAIVTLIGVFLDIIILYRTIHAVRLPLMQIFIIPVLYFVQLLLTTFGLLYLIHSPKAKLWKCWWIYAPIGLWAAVYIVAFLIHGGFSISAAAYLDFLKTTTSSVLLVIVLAYDFIALLYFSYTLIVEVRKYRVIVENNFIDKVETNAMIMVKMVHFFLANFGIICINSLVSVFASPEVARIFGVLVVWMNTGVFLACVVVILNLHNFFYAIAHAFAHEVDERPETAAMQTVTDVTDSASTIELQVKRWSNLSSKPYLQEGLTISSVAEQMKVSTRILSDYLNNVMSVNFNSWINSLRVEEIKRMLDEDNKISMSSLAFQTGFTDASAMSKVFKKFEGISPTAYRRRE